MAKKMEIERKYLIGNIDEIGFDIEAYEKKHYLQAYISTSPTIRIRKEGGDHVLCVKGGGSLAREEFELALSKKEFEGLWQKIETGAVSKYRYFIPIDGGLTAELDIYLESLEGFITVEVEFESVEDANSFVPPSWFGEDVTGIAKYKNSYLARYGLQQ